MSGFDGRYEQASILSRGQNLLVGGRVFDSVPDEYALPKDTNGLIRPYCLVQFGAQVPLGTDRSLGPETDQPQVMSVGVECWAATKGASRAVASAVRQVYTDWPPSDAASGLRARGGSFADRVGSGGGSRYLELVSFDTIINLGGGDSDGAGVTDPAPYRSQLELAVLEADQAAAQANAALAQVLAERQSIASQLTASESFTFVQAAPTTTWTITHPLGYAPFVVTIATDGTEVEGVVTYPQATSVVRIDFALPTAGTAYLS